MSERHVALAAVDPGVLLGAEPIEHIDGGVEHTELRSRGWLGLTAALAAGIAVGLLAAVALIPDQPERILVPVEQPAPSFHVDPETGVRT